MLKSKLSIIILDWTITGLLRHYKHIVMMFTTLLLMLASSLANAAHVRDINVDGSKVVITFDDIVVGAKTLTLSGPDRIAIDIEGGTLHKGVNTRSQGNPQSNGSYARNKMVSKIRAAQFAPDTARIVLDMSAPTAVKSGYFSSDGRALHLALAPLAGGQRANISLKQLFQPPAGFAAKKVRKPYSVSVRLPKAKKQIGLPKVLGGNDRNKPLVVIDAGHGGHDPGAISPHGGKREKDITLAIAKRIRDQLLATGRVRVALTRDDDKYLVLTERYSIARRLNADLFISVHADAAGSEAARGATVYTLSEVASDRETAKLAARENKSDVIRGLDLSGADPNISPILIDLRQRETMNLSSDFAKLLLREGDGRMNFRTYSHRFASFVVLKAPDVPSILLETGYLTNAKDVSRLSSRAGQNQIADSVADAVTVYFARQLALR
jgi:N-acetylmuramoyl-L-alanine amidase